MPQLDLGRLRFAYQGVYNGSTVYERNDVVSYNNDVYVYIAETASSGNNPIDTSRWAKMMESLVAVSGPDAGKLLTTDGVSTSWTNTVTLDTLTVGTKLTSDIAYIGFGAEAFEASAGLTDAALVINTDGGSNSFAQVAFRNVEPTSSTDIIAYSSNGDDSNGWVGIGITGDKFDDSTYGITGQGDSYIFSQTTLAGDTKSVTNKALTDSTATLTATTHGFQEGQRVVVAGVDSTFNGEFTITAVTLDTFSYFKDALNVSSTPVSPSGTAKIQSAGNLVIATGDAGTQNRIVFAAGGYASGNTQMIIIPDEQVHIEIATASTSPTTGALRVAGGVGITGDTFTDGDLTLDGVLYVGPDAPAFETSAGLTAPAQVTTITGPASSFAQMAFTNTESSSSTDIIAYMDNGDDSQGWVGMGIAGSTFDDSTYGITGPGDAYIFHETVAGELAPEYTGNLVIATGANGSENKIVFAAGGFSSGTTQMEITPGINVHIEIPTPSTSPTTGALTVVGGVGIQGDMNIQGNVAIEGTITFGGSGTTVETANLSVTDPFVFVGTNNQADIVDLAFIGEYATTVSPIVATVTNKALTSNVATLTTSADHTYLAGDVVTVTDVDTTFNGTFNIIDVPTTTTFTYAKTAGNVSSTAVSPTGTATVNARRKFSGVARDASDGVIKFFKDATVKPTSTINFSEAGLTYASIKVGAADIGNVTNAEIGYLSGVSSSIQTQLGTKLDTTTASSTYAPLASPALTGTPTAPTAAVDTNSTQLATTAYVVGQGYLKSSTAASTYAPLTAASLTRPVLTSAFETATVSATAATGTVSLNVSTSSVLYYTSNATANWVLNITGTGGLNSLLSTGQSVTIVFLNTNGAIAYYPTSIQVDGTTSGVTTRWQGGAAVTTGNPSSVDAYTATIVKTANATFSVFISQTRFA